MLCLIKFLKNFVEIHVDYISQTILISVQRSLKVWRGRIFFSKSYADFFCIYPGEVSFGYTFS